MVFLKSFIGFQVSNCLISLMWLQIVSEMMLHSKGPGAQPNVRQRFIRATPNSGIWVTVFTAMLLCRCILQYADLTPSFFASILLFGNFLLAATA
jgi:hypothetical protein